jgi:hypothetical protein
VADAWSLKVFRSDGTFNVLSPDRAAYVQDALVQVEDLDGDPA